MSRPPPPPPPPTTNKDQQHQNPSLQEINIKVFGKKSAMQLIQSGEKERLKELLRERLLECGWIEEMKALCRGDHQETTRHNNLYCVKATPHSTTTYICIMASPPGRQHNLHVPYLPVMWPH
ncbi:hypothetical protein J1N35_029074 [Gossypium stocksii]|uniref:Transcription and mRNA export factor ENY2 n=1 Tax=Gossypium stocksii TaxID=47602 RepID=A0A9D3ZT04_9ROSI|nr:hypothetical protein J1N35_029074 [Gossypium stocksii]